MRVGNSLVPAGAGWDVLKSNVECCIGSAHHNRIESRTADAAGKVDFAAALLPSALEICRPISSVDRESWVSSTRRPPRTSPLTSPARLTLSWSKVGCVLIRNGVPNVKAMAKFSCRHPVRDSGGAVLAAGVICKPAAASRGRRLVVSVEQSVVRRPCGPRDSELQEVIERVDVGCRDIGIGGEIAERVEARRRVAALEPAELPKVQQRIDAAAATSA